MTAVALDLDGWGDEGRAEWDLAVSGGFLAPEDVRTALMFAAEVVVADPSWLTHERWVVIKSSLARSACPDVEARFEILVTATRSRFGPRISLAVDNLMRMRAERV